MNVSQLIEALQQMPPHAEVITHADNHTTNRDNSIRVGFALSNNQPAVVIGNWSTYNMLCWNNRHSGMKLADKSFVVLSYGDDKGTLIQQAHTFVDKHEVPVTRHDTIEATFKLEKLP